MAPSSTSSQSRRAQTSSSPRSEAPSDKSLDKTAAVLEMERRCSKLKLKTSPTTPRPSITKPIQNKSNDENKPPTPMRRKSNNHTSPGSTGPTSSPSAVARRMRRLQEGNLHLDNGEGFMPSAKNSFKFKYDSPCSGRTAAELDALLSLPARAPLEAKSKYINLSYDRFGEPPAQAKLGSPK